MKRVLILVEGQTEERFVKDVLSPRLWRRNVDPVPKIAITKRIKSGSDFKGGITDYGKVTRDLYRLLGDTGIEAVTTMIDYYGLPSGFPGLTTRPQGDFLERAKHVEEEWKKDVAHPRFHPFLMIHEFEAILFSKPEELSRALNMPEARQELLYIRDSFQTPEEINDNPTTAPSKRIARILPGYQKVLHGPQIASRIGLTLIRKECPHFDEWLSWLEAL